MERIFIFLMVCISMSVNGQTWTLKNSSISRTIGVMNKTVTTSQIENGYTKNSLKTTGNEFEIFIDGHSEPITSLNSEVIEIEQEKKSGVHLLKVKLRNRKINGEIVLNYSLSDDQFWGHKWIEIKPNGSSVVKVNKIVVESLGMEAQKQATSQGKGQPVYLDNLFFGLEWPIAENRFEENKLKCWHHPGYDITADYVSQKAVWGAAPENCVQRWFLTKYVDSIRKTPLKPTVLYNSWYDIRELNSTVLSGYENTIDVFKKNLVERYQIPIDYIVPDDGWQNRKSIYQSEDEKSHKQLRRTIERELNASKLGIWMPIHGCRAFDMKWAEKNGYEIAVPRIWASSTMCLSMPNYKAELKKRLKHFIVDEHVLYFKHDNNQLYCPNENHNHRANSDSQVEEMFELMDYMKELNPDVYLNYTTGMNMSVWWLKGCDCIWMGGGDVGSAGIGNKREQAITYRDTRMRHNQASQFPMNSLMTHGIIKGRYMMGFQKEEIEHWKNYVWMFVSRGVSMYELYLSPEYLTKKEWTFLGETLKWAIENREILNYHTEFIMGDVRKKEPYGYSHFKEDKGIVFLRNPSDNTKYDVLSQLKVEKWERAKLEKPLTAKQIAKDKTLKWCVHDINNVAKTTHGDLAYKASFERKENWNGKRLQISFVGIDEESKIYLNNKLIGTHSGTKGVIDPQTQEEMLNNWHYDYKSYYKYNATGKFIEIDAEILKEKNELIIVQNNTGKVAGVYGSVDIRPILSRTKQNAVLNIDPVEMGFDAKYKTASVKWISNSSVRKNEVLKVGEKMKLDFDPFEVNVIEITLSE